MASRLELLEFKQEGKAEKMSKSRGNVITIDQVVNRISHVEDGYEFRDIWGDVIEKPLDLEIWRDNDSMFFCGPKWDAYWKVVNGKESGHCPVFLCRQCSDIPLTLNVRGSLRQQHPFEFEFWDAIYQKYPDEFVEIPGSQPFFTARIRDAGIYSQYE